MFRRALPGALTIAVVLAGVSPCADAASITIFNDTFESAPAVAVGVAYAYAGPGLSVSGTGGTIPVQGFAASGLPFSGFFLWNGEAGDPAAASVLTLTGLQPHTGVSLGMLLAILATWDGTGHYGPDRFTIAVGDGTTETPVFSHVFDNANSGAGQTYSYGSGVHGNFGNFPDAFTDSGYNITSSLQNITHTASTLVLRMYAWDGGNNGEFQGWGDESWAIDNLTVTLEGATQPVPEPATLALVGSSLAALAVRRRRRQRS